MSQRVEIYKYLQANKTITVFEAMNHPRIRAMRLAARIEQLRKNGLNIYTEMFKENGKRYARYHLIESAKKNRAA